MKSPKVIIFGALAALAALLAGGRKASAKRRPEPAPLPPPAQSDSGAELPPEGPPVQGAMFDHDLSPAQQEALLRSTAKQAAVILGDPAVENLILATAYTESRMRGAATNARTNASGYFQLREASAYPSGSQGARLGEPGPIYPTVAWDIPVRDIPWAVALILYYWRRTHKNFGNDSRNVTYSRLRATGLYPALIKPGSRFEEHYPASRGRYEEARRALGISSGPARPDEKVKPWAWPGVVALARRLGATEDWVKYGG